MGSSRQEYWNGLPFSSPGDLPNPGNEPGSPAFQADSLPTELWGKPVNVFGSPLLYLAHYGFLIVIKGSRGTVRATVQLEIGKTNKQTNKQEFAKWKWVEDGTTLYKILSPERSKTRNITDTKWSPEWLKHVWELKFKLVLISHLK